MDWAESGNTFLVLSPIYLLSLILDVVTLQLGELKHSDSYLKGWQQMFMGLLFVHWATIWVKIELSGMVPSPERCRAQGNAIDFIFEHFIVHLLGDTRWTPPIERWSLTVIAIQICTLKAEYKNPAIISQWLNTGSIVRFTLNYCSYALFYRTNADHHLEGTSNGPPMILLPKCLIEPNSLNSILNSLIGSRGAAPSISEKFHCMGWSE